MQVDTQLTAQVHSNHPPAPRFDFDNYSGLEHAVDGDSDMVHSLEYTSGLFGS